MKTLRCMAYQQNGVFVAACLDLSLATQADSMMEAMENLDLQIRDYIQEALSEPEYRDSLLNRKAPLSMWVKYWLIAFRMFFNKKQGPAKLFSEQIEATA